MKQNFSVISGDNHRFVKFFRQYAGVRHKLSGLSTRARHSIACMSSATTAEAGFFLTAEFGFELINRMQFVC
jgi:hypothetical protein